MKVLKPTHIHHIKRGAHHVSWFIVGFLFAFFVLVSLFLIYFQFAFANRAIPGVFVGNVYVGKKTQNEIKNIFDQKNEKIENTTFRLSIDQNIATISAKDLEIGYNSSLMADQALSVGKGSDVISNLYIILKSYLSGTFLPSSYTQNTEKLTNLLAPIQKSVYKEPVNAQFSVQNNRVATFKQSQNGQTINYEKLQEQIEKFVPGIVRSIDNQVIILTIPLSVLKPALTTEKANSFGIVEEIGRGTSLFAHSIPGRIHNVALAASRINGVLVAPGETFSFVKNLGDVTAYTGYQQAYVIINGKTVLGDGGGVCQVSTTLFRAILNAGLPIVERTAHAYRVGYYEQDSPPGLDATVYYPSVDLKFKNDTGKHILIVADTDLNNLRLTFTLYGKKDGRQVSMTTPVILSQTPAPETKYQDDPTLPKGELKQLDFAAAGAKVTFSRTVTRDGKVLTNDTYNSSYQPWAAVFLRGTKE